MSTVSTASFFGSGNGSTTSGRRSTSSSASNLHVSSGGRSSAIGVFQEPSMRNRENLVVSNREIRQLFDTIKELGDVVKRQNSKLDNMGAKLEASYKEVSDVKTQIQTLLYRDAAEKENVYRGPVPKQLKGDTHLLHNKQEIEHQFCGSEGIDSAHNSAVRSFLCKELEKENNDYDKSTIKRAVSRYYETKRQQYLDSLPDRRNTAEKRQFEKKLTSRRRRLFIKRMKVASGTDKEALKEIDPHFMSDEEDGEGGDEGSWVVRSPPWRSPQLSSMLKRLQDKIDSQQSGSHPKNTRVQGEPSTRSPPTLPGWAILPDNQERHQRSPSPQPIPLSPQSPAYSSYSASSDEGDAQHGESSRVLDKSPVARRRQHRRVRPLSNR